jgi:transposase
MCNTVWVGIDLAKKSFYAALAPLGTRPDEWAKLQHRAFDHSAPGVTALCCWVEHLGYTREQIAGVCVEATGSLAWLFTELLEDRLGPVSIVNPAYPHQFAKSLGLREKTDRTDACALALYGLALRPVPRPLPSVRQRTLRELAKLYADSRSDLTAVDNQLGEPIQSPFVRKHLQNKHRQLEKALVAIEKEMDTITDEDPQMGQDAKRMQTIPGVGPKTARALLAQLGDLRQYTRAELTARAGLYPRQHQSGTSVRKRPRLAKGGGAAVRTALYMAALNARRFCPHLRTFADRLKQNGLSNMAILGAVMRKLLLLIRTLIVHQTDYNPQQTNYLKTP